MTEHTPGPWTDEPWGTTARVIEAGNGATLAIVHCYLRTDWPNVAQRDANARLIAAAPELLAALQRAEGIVSFHAGVADKTVSPLAALNILAELRAALAKADSP
jgi:hypothetical protein